MHRRGEDYVFSRCVPDPVKIADVKKQSQKFEFLFYAVLCKKVINVSLRLYTTWSGVYLEGQKLL